MIRTNEFEPRVQRISRRTTRLDESIVMSILGERKNEMDRENILFKSLYFEVTDRVCRQIQSRFQENNEILMAVERSKSHTF